VKERAAGALARLQRDMAALALTKGAPPPNGAGGARPVRERAPPPPKPPQQRRRVAASEWGKEVERLDGGERGSGSESGESEGEGGAGGGGGHGQGWQQPGDFLSVEGYRPRSGARAPPRAPAAEVPAESGDGQTPEPLTDEEELFLPRDLPKRPPPSRGKPFPAVLFPPCPPLPDAPDTEFQA